MAMEKMAIGAGGDGSDGLGGDRMSCGLAAECAAGHDAAGDDALAACRSAVGQLAIILEGKIRRHWLCGRGV